MSLYAYYDSVCPECGDDIWEGDEIIGSEDGFIHAECEMDWDLFLEGVR